MKDAPILPPNSSEHLLVVTATGNIGLWALDLATSEAWRNLAHDQLFGYEELLPEWTYEMFLEHVVDEDRAYVDQLYRESVMSKEEWSFECRIVRTDGDLRWISAHGRRFGSPETGDERLVGHVLDITRIKRAEDRLRLISQEQSHRIRNLLSVVQAMVKSTLRHSPDLGTFQKTFFGRLAALIRSHELLARRTESAEIDLSEVVSNEIAALVPPQRVHLSGVENVEIDADTGEGLSLILHELLTNALKHGALSVDGGSVTLDVSPAGPNLMRATWTESGGPPVTAPKREGFGTRLLSSSLRGAGSAPEIDFRPEGVVCRWEFPAGSASH